MFMLRVTTSDTTIAGLMSAPLRWLNTKMDVVYAKPQASAIWTEAFEFTSARKVSWVRPAQHPKTRMEQEIILNQ